MKLEYECFYNGRRWSCVAESSRAATDAAIQHWHPPKSQRHMVFVLLAKKDGQTVAHRPGDV
jgi:hypothetical protein